MNDKPQKIIYFISKYASWQSYRHEVLDYLGNHYNAHIEVLTTGKLKPYIHNTKHVTYRLFRSLIPYKAKPGFFPSAILHIMRNKPDVVLCQNDTLQFTEYLAFAICKLMGIRFVWWTHAHMPANEYRWHLHRKLRQAYALTFLRFGDAVLSYCETGRQYLIQKKVPRKKVFCAPNTLNTEVLFKEAERFAKFDKQKLVADLNLPKADFYLLYLGRLMPRKRVNHAIELVARLRNQHDCNAHLIILGDGRERQHLERLTREIADGHVTFAGGVYDRELKGQYFQLADLFVMPGAVGLAIIHAFVFGLPLVTEAVPNHGPEISYFKNGKNGIMTPSGELEQMAKDVALLMQDKTRLENMALCAKKTIQENASIALMSSRMAEALVIDH